MLVLPEALTMLPFYNMLTATPASHYLHSQIHSAPSPSFLLAAPKISSRTAGDGQLELEVAGSLFAAAGMPGQTVAPVNLALEKSYTSSSSMLTKSRNSQAVHGRMQSVDSGSWTM